MVLSQLTQSWMQQLIRIWYCSQCIAALSTAYSKVDNVVIVIAGISYLSPSTPSSLPTSICSNDDNGVSASSFSPSSEAQSSPGNFETTIFFIEPRLKTFIFTSGVLAFRQVSQQNYLAWSLDSLNVSLCCASETRTHFPSLVTELTSPPLLSRDWLHTESDTNTAAVALTGVALFSAPGLKRHWWTGFP